MAMELTRIKLFRPDQSLFYRRYVPDEPGTTQYTPLGLELNVELMSIFAGAVELWDIPLLLDLMGHLDDEEAEAIYTSTSQHPEQVIRRHVLQVYFKFCNRSKR